MVVLAKPLHDQSNSWFDVIIVTEIATQYFRDFSEKENIIRVVVNS